MIEVRHLCKHYGTQEAVSDLSFILPDRGVIGLVGHNGSGKSTTMKMLAGCLTPTGGEIIIDGRPLAGSADLRSRIGYLPEIPPLYPDMTVQEQLDFAANIRGIPKAVAASKTREAMERLHVWEVRNRLIANLSKGYRQRVGFAQALIGEPDFLLLDEPTVGLDPAQLKEVREAVLSLSENHLILLSSHILSEIASCCSRLLVLSCGRLTADDTLENLIRSHSPKGRWLLIAESSADVLVPVLSTMPAVSSFESRSTAPGLSAFVIQQAPDSAFQGRLLQTLIDQRILVRRFEPVTPSLEELFLRLTRDMRYKE